MRPRLSLLLVAWVSLLSLACSSTKAVQGSPAQVRFHEYRRGGKVMAIVNESHSDKVEFYSKERDDASTKVATDEIMEALIEEIERVQFGKFARDGKAPTSSTDWSQAIEVVTSTGARHMIVRAGIPQEEADAFRGTRDAFLAIYNNIFGAQSVRLKPGEQGFEQPQVSQ